MPCALTKGFTLDCKTTGGIVEIKVKAMPSSLTGIVVNTDGTATFPAPPDPLTKQWYTYKLEPQMGQLDEKLSANPSNRAYSYEQTLKVPLYVLSKDKQTELKLVAQNDLLIAVKDNNGNAWLMGYSTGADLTEAIGTTGKAFEDKNGYELTFVCKNTLHLLDITTSYNNLTET